MGDSIIIHVKRRYYAIAHLNIRTIFSQFPLYNIVHIEQLPELHIIYLHFDIMIIVDKK